MRFWLFSEG
jgi:hypothetical protein